MHYDDCLWLAAAAPSFLLLLLVVAVVIVRWRGAGNMAKWPSSWARIRSFCRFDLGISSRVCPRWSCAACSSVQFQNRFYYPFYSLGRQVEEMVLYHVFWKFPLLAWAAWQLQFSPPACGTLRKHVTKPFPQFAAPLCSALIEKA